MRRRSWSSVILGAPASGPAKAARPQKASEKVERTPWVLDEVACVREAPLLRPCPQAFLLLHLLKWGVLPQPQAVLLGVMTRVAGSPRGCRVGGGLTGQASALPCDTAGHRPRSDHRPCGPLPARRRARKVDGTLSGLYTLEGEMVAGIPASVSPSSRVYGDDHGGSSRYEGPALCCFCQGFPSLVRNTSCLRLHGQCDSQGAF